MKNSKGITLVSLIITIIVLLILASIATYSGLNVINSSKLTTFTTELKIMQTEVNTLYKEDKQRQIGQEITGDVQTQANKVFTEAESGITSQEGYRYWNQNQIKELGIEGIEQDFFINLEKRSVVSYKGFKMDGKTYYTLNQLPNGLYNVEYENPNQGKPTFQISQEKLSDGKWKITVSDIQYTEGYINKWQVRYQIEGKENWNTTKDLSFVVTKPGSYHVALINGEIKSDEQIISIDSSWKEEVNINAPNLMEGMIAVYWDADNNEQELKSTSTTEEWNNWYDYVEGDNKTDTKTSKWANAKITKDGAESYFVWIPRYEYKILSGEGTSEAGNIEVKFISTTQTTPDEGYKIHPAFTNGITNNFKNGEWDSELSGIWVAKYEMSMEMDGNHIETSSDTIGNVLTKNAGNTSNISAVSKPNVSSWRNITIGNCYTNAYYYDREKESHLIKNSEWGAVAYLSHSQYGRNGHEMDFNNSSTFITGNGGGSPSASQNSGGITNAYNTSIGAQASTTGNIYGIYDFSGGAKDISAGYITNGNSNLSKGNSFVKTAIPNSEGYKTLSTKYVTVYPYDSSSDSYANNYTTYRNANYGYGDAILETSTEGSGGSYSWFGDFARFPSSAQPFFTRGGSYNDNTLNGPFCFSTTDSNTIWIVTFRVVLANK